jgi:DNA-binding PucR family transcriptional regulator
MGALTMATEYTLSETRMNIILALADHRMNVTDAASATNMHRNSIIYNVERIRQTTGKDPLDFYDLYELVQMVKRERGPEDA